MHPGRYSNKGTWNKWGGVEYLGFDLEQSGTPHARKKWPIFCYKKSKKKKVKRIKIVGLIIENSRW